MTSEQDSKSVPKKSGAGHLRKIMLTGVLIIIPLFLTGWVLLIIFTVLDGIVSPAVHGVIRFYAPNVGRIPGIGLATMIVLIYVTGLLTSNVVGNKVLQWWEELIHRVPFIKSIYKATKQLTSAITMQDETSFQRVVFVEFPKADSYCVGFVTKEAVDNNGQEMLAVFLATAPNPTTGFIMIVPKVRVIPTNMSVEDGIKIIMSGGLAADSKLDAVFPIATAIFSREEIERLNRDMVA